mgnify:CR=1 FL=1
MLCIGFDVGGTNARGCLMEFTDATAPPRQLAEVKERIRDTRAPSQVAAVMADIATRLVEQEGVDPAQIESAGVGIAGQLDKTGNTVVGAPNLGWTNVPFKSVLVESLAGAGFTPPVRIVNDLAANVWGEFCVGAARGHQDVLAVYVGTGVGGGVIAAGKLYGGHGGKAGEIGHSKVVPHGAPCGCGQRGCVEAYVGGRRLEERLTQDYRAGRSLGLRPYLPVELRDVDHMHMDAIIRPDVADAAAAAGELYADGLWSYVADLLAMAIANGAMVLNPGLILLGGGVLRNTKELSRRVVERIPSYILRAAADDIEIRFGELGDDAGVYGAALLARG